ncbi:MAG: YraN family protein, partial [Alphaproteobacteria bacterium]
RAHRRRKGVTNHRRAYLRGHTAEHRCALLLRLKGWRIVARDALTEALEAVTPHQQRRIKRAASAFLSQHPKWRTLGFRFDVMAVTPWLLPKHVTDAWRPETE